MTQVECLRTAESIAAAQEPSGAIPWFPGGHTDPWDHVECAMALTAAGLYDTARHAYRWLASTQRPDGSWPAKVRAGVVEDASGDSNFCAYLATGVWHYYLCTEDRGFLDEMMPVVRPAIDFVLGLQTARGEIVWCRDDSGPAGEALLTGCASIAASLRCALAAARFLGDPQPDWDVALSRLGHALVSHPEAFADKRRYSMDWYYPVLCGAMRGRTGRARLRAEWSRFVVPGLGARCVDDEPWVTGAETCELVMALDAVDEYSSAQRQFAAMQHLREVDGSYWTGLVLTDGKRWPEERTTWTAAAVILAADALSRTTDGNGIFRRGDLSDRVDAACADADCACLPTAFRSAGTR